VSKAGLFLEEYRMKGEVPPEERMENDLIIPRKKLQAFLKKIEQCPKYGIFLNISPFSS